MSEQFKRMVPEKASFKIPDPAANDRVAPMYIEPQLFSMPDAYDDEGLYEAYRKTGPELHRVALEARRNVANNPSSFTLKRGGARINLPIEDGCVMVVSDAHYRGKPSRAHKASIVLANALKPYAIIANGDALDFASISRWAPVSFEELTDRPTVAAELSTAIEHLGEYEELPFVRLRAWNYGNHDARFERRLVENAPEFAGVSGFSLRDHFPGWIFGWRTDLLTDDGRIEVVTKHKFKGGLHAGQNNALWSGCSTVTGHDHMLKAYSLTNAHGLFWGIHAGTIAPIDSPAFLYAEDNPVNWQSGFVFLHFRNGRFTGPELVNVTPDGRVLFRGDVLKV